MTMINNTIPSSYAAIVTLAGKALAGAVSNGVAVGLEHNTDAEIALDLHDLIGDPATPAIPGKQDVLNTRKAAAKTAHDNRRVAVIAGREYCRLAVALLKPVLGTRYNSAWEHAGFLTPSLAMPDHPEAMLVSFRQYFAANPARENAATSITSAQAQTLLTAIQNTGLAVASARDARRDARVVRDAALVQLRQRLSGLRGELDQLLEDDDGRWESFGFRRPADGSMPLPVPDLVLTPGGPGIVLAQWGLASLAENYRVSWRIVGNPAEPTGLGLFTERQCALTGLPSGQNIVVLVSARNDSGETEPTEAAIVVP